MDPDALSLEMFKALHLRVSHMEGKLGGEWFTGVTGVKELKDRADKLETNLKALYETVTKLSNVVTQNADVFNKARNELNKVTTDLGETNALLVKDTNATLQAADDIKNLSGMVADREELDDLHTDVLRLNLEIGNIMERIEAPPDPLPYQPTAPRPPYQPTAPRPPYEPPAPRPPPPPYEPPAPRPPPPSRPPAYSPDALPPQDHEFPETPVYPPVPLPRPPPYADARCRTYPFDPVSAHNKTGKSIGCRNTKGKRRLI